MKLNILKKTFYSIIFMIASLYGNAAETKESSDGKKFNAKEMIMHHVKDAHGFHAFEWNEKPVSLALPIILYDKNFTVFMSSEFHHDDSGTHIVKINGNQYVKLHEKIYQLNLGETSLKFDETHHPVNATSPIDLSITRNVFMMWVSVLVLLLLFISSARKYKNADYTKSLGIAGFVEPLILFVRDEIARPMIGEKKYEKYMPYLLTVFFFIWLNNIFGLIPILNGANLSGNIAFTMVLAGFTFIITTLSGNKNYWKHIFWMPGVPVPMKIFLMPIELIGIFTKPISLMIRLFANITAGHIIILALMSLIFIFKTIAVAPVSVAFSLFIIIIEIVVTAIQAYIFTILSALYFGMATEEEHH